MARREIVRRALAGVPLIEIIHSISRRTFARFAVTTSSGLSRRDFVNLREARRAFDEQIAAPLAAGESL